MLWLCLLCRNLPGTEARALRRSALFLPRGGVIVSDGSRLRTTTIAAAITTAPTSLLHVTDDVIAVYLTAHPLRPTVDPLGVQPA